MSDIKSGVNSGPGDDFPLQPFPRQCHLLPVLLSCRLVRHSSALTYPLFAVPLLTVPTGPVPLLSATVTFLPFGSHHILTSEQRRGSGFVIFPD